jgi:hypothetical protein
MDFDERDFGERDKNERDKSPVEVILGIREELAEFKKAGGREALLAKLRETRERDLRASMIGPDPFGLDFVIEYLRDRGVIPQALPRWQGKAVASRPRRRRRRRRDAENR